MDEEAHLSFFLEWYDPQADQIKPYILHFYHDQTLELIERKTRRVFLKRIRIPTVSLSDLFIGASITIYSRQLTIIEPANEFTKNQLQLQASKATFVVTPRGYRYMGKILSAIELSASEPDALLLVNVVIVQLEASHVNTLTKHFTPEASATQQLLTKDVSLLIEVKLSTPNALEDAKAKLDAAKLSEFVLIGECGIDRLLPVSAPLPTTAVLDNCSLCLMRPRMLREKHVGEILDEILSAGFEVSALKLFHFKMGDANEFYSVYKGVYRQYHEVLKYMTSAPCIAVEIRGDDVVRNFRELCGPHDIQVARVLRPKSLRARFGKSNLHNALHCTDCPEDGVLEAQFIFSTLS